MYNFTFNVPTRNHFGKVVAGGAKQDGTAHVPLSIEDIVGIFRAAF